MNRIDELEMKMDRCDHGRLRPCWMCAEEDYERRHSVLIRLTIAFAIVCFLFFGITASCRGGAL